MGCCSGPREAADFDGDHEGLSQADLARFGGDDMTCRACGEDMYSDAAMCPACGEMVMEESAGSGRSGFVVALLAAAVTLGAVGILVW